MQLKNGVIKNVFKKRKKSEQELPPKECSIVAFSDTHGYHRDVEPFLRHYGAADVLLFCGDMTMTGERSIEADFLDMFDSLPQKNKYMIPGNHDLTYERPFRDERIDKYDITGKLVTADCGLTFYGFPWTPRFGNWAFMLQRGGAEMRERVNAIQECDFLVSHGPPQGACDKVGSEHVGCEVLEEYLLDTNNPGPRNGIFCGHIHEMRGQNWSVPRTAEKNNPYYAERYYRRDGGLGLNDVYPDFDGRKVLYIPVTNVSCVDPAYFTAYSGVYMKFAMYPGSEMLSGIAQDAFMPRAGDESNFGDRLKKWVSERTRPAFLSDAHARISLNQGLGGALITEPITWTYTDHVSSGTIGGGITINPGITRNPDGVYTAISLDREAPGTQWYRNNNIVAPPTDPVSLANEAAERLEQQRVLHEQLQQEQRREQDRRLTDLLQQEVRERRERPDPNHPMTRPPPWDITRRRRR